jgi:hypothetical protein
MAFHSHVASATSDGSEEDPKDAMREMFGPAAVDQQIRAAISTCWTLLPKERRSPDNVATEARRIFERALTNFKDDAKAFGFDATTADLEKKD